jgi:hypothetical protein
MSMYVCDIIGGDVSLVPEIFHTDVFVNCRYASYVAYMLHSWQFMSVPVPGPVSSLVNMCHR